MIAVLLLFFQLSSASLKRRAADRSLNAGASGGSSASKASSGQTRCNQEMMTSYGLTGEAFATTASHKYCPMIRENCCTSSDAETSMTIWKTEFRPKIERYYETYLYSLKYILGYSTEIGKLADEFSKSTVSDCKAAAQEFVKMNVSPKVTQDIYKSFVISLEKMSDVRRGFYCTLCDANTQQELIDYVSAVNLFYNDRIYYSKEFCKKLVDSTIRASYFAVFFLKPFAELSSTLINCRANNGTKLTYEIDYWTRTQVKNCYYFKAKYFFFFCERYCEKFHLVKPSDILDGNLKELKKFVDHIMQYRQSVFLSPSNNYLMDGLSYEEDYLKEYLVSQINEKVLIKSSVSNVQLDKFETDIVYSGGMDPLASIENCAYPLVLSGVRGLRAVALLLSMALALL